MKKEKLFDLFENNEELFNTTIEELDNYNSYLSDDRYYEMEEINQHFHAADPVNLLQRAFFGYDSETWHTDAHNNKIYGAFNPNRNYFKYNGYGNLVSCDYKDYSAHLNDWFIDSLIENANNLYLGDEIIEVIEECKQWLLT